VDDVIEFGAQLIVLDIRLANGYGHLLCKDLKANPSTLKIPVILISGADNLAAIAADCGADAYLQKPFGIPELIAIVTETIKHSKVKRNPSV
jgi:DNA-binding response OmpR family regulator